MLLEIFLLLIQIIHVRVSSGSSDTDRVMSMSPCRSDSSFRGFDDDDRFVVDQSDECCEFRVDDDGGECCDDVLVRFDDRHGDVGDVDSLYDFAGSVNHIRNSTVTWKCKKNMKSQESKTFDKIGGIQNFQIVESGERKRHLEKSGVPRSSGKARDPEHMYS